MASMNDYYAQLANFGSTQVPMFSQGQTAVDPYHLSPMVTDPVTPAQPSWQAATPVNMAFDPTAGAASGNWWDGIVGTKENPGWGGLAVGGASALMNGFLGLKQYGLAKQALAENKRQFELNYNAQKSTTNTALEDRQRARVASNPGAYQSVGDYMNQNGIK